MLIMHEVGHAIYTPNAKWISAVENHTRGFKSFINITEDGRIERKMKGKFPGAKRTFYEGYKQIAQRDFFEAIKNKTPMKQIAFIDRLNMYFKIGNFVKIPFFGPEERAFVGRAEETDTFEDALFLAEDIWAWALAKNESKKTPTVKEALDALKTMKAEADGEGDAAEAEESEEEEAEEEAEEAAKEPEEKHSLPMMDEFASIREKDESEEDENEKDPDAENGVNGGEKEEESEVEDELAADESEEFDKNQADKLVDRTAVGFSYFEFGVVDKYKEIIEPFKDILEQLNPNLADQSLKLFDDFVRNSNPTINFMAKEFEVRKAADQYTRAKTAKSGTIDPTKMHTYQYSEDIFKRLSILPGNKNHGMIMLVDFSGSMTENMFGTVIQLMNLVMFCRKVGIPHRVYAFQDSWGGLKSAERRTDKVTAARDAYEQRHDDKGQLLSTEITVTSGLVLLELFSEKMKLMDYRNMSRHLLDWGRSKAPNYGKSYNPFSNYGHYANNVFQLGGTPMNDALMVMRKVCSDFRRETNTQIINLITLTDGDSGLAGGCSRWENVAYGAQVVYRDKLTKFEKNTGKVMDSHKETAFLMDLIRNDHNVHCVSFRIESNKKLLERTIQNARIDSKLPVMREDLKTAVTLNKVEGYTAFPGYHGYNDYYLIPGGNDLLVQGDEIFEKPTNKDGKLSVAKTVQTLAKANIRKSTSRVLLTRFIRLIANK